MAKSPKPPAILGIQCLLSFIAISNTLSAWQLARVSGQAVALVSTIALVLATVWVVADLQSPTRYTRATAAAVVMTIAAVSVMRLLELARGDSDAKTLGAGLMTLLLGSSALSLLLSEPTIKYLSRYEPDDADPTT